MSEKSTKLIECSSFLEFSANANQIQTRQEICDHLLLTVMGRFAITRGEIALENGERFIRGKKDDAQFRYQFPLTYADQHLGTMFLGNRLIPTPLAEQEKMFIVGLCSLSGTFMKNIAGREELKQANRNLSKKILELNSLFELSRELLLLKSVPEAAALCLNELSGQLMLQQMIIGVKEKSGSYRCFGRNITPPAENLTVEEIQEVSGISDKVAVEDKVFLLAGKKMNRQPFNRTDKEFSNILLNFLATTVENIYMIEDMVAKEKLEREILIARDIQQKLLPLTLPRIDRIDIRAQMKTFGEVGGDYYDAITLSETRLFFLMADVTGKGIPAALIMSAVQSSLKTLISTGHDDLTLIADSLNRLICDTTEGNKFVSMFMGILDTAASSLIYLNSGHNRPVLFHRDTPDFKTLSKGGMVLGLFPETEYASGSVPFCPGDRLFMYTDGLTEICDENGEEFGEAALYRLLIREREKPCKEILDCAICESITFGNDKLVDDVTAMCIEFKM